MDEKNIKSEGKEPNARATLTIDDDQWFAYNEQYYKVRKL
jgi:hypothetical protein